MEGGGEVGEKVDPGQSEAVEMSKSRMKDHKEEVCSQKEIPEKMTTKDTDSEKMMIGEKEVSKKEIMFGTRALSEAEKQLMIGLKEGNEEESRITFMQRIEIEKKMGTSFIPVVIIEAFEMMMEKMKAAKPEATKLHNAYLMNAMI